MNTAVALRNNVEAARAELRRNPRLRRMVAMAGLILVFYGVLVADDLRIGASEERAPVLGRLARLEAIASDSTVDFATLHEQEAAINRKLREQIWLASSPGLASADLQSWLRRVAIQAGIEKVRLELSDIRPVEGMRAPLWKLEAELSATDVSAGSLIELLRLVDAHDRHLEMQQLSYLPKRGRRLRVLFVVHFVMEAPGS